MTEYIEINEHTHQTIFKASKKLAGDMSLQVRELLDQLPDDDKLCVSACMQMLIQAIVMHMTMETLLTDEDYIDHFCDMLRNTHKRLYPNLRAQMLETARKHFGDIGQNEL